MVTTYVVGYLGILHPVYFRRLKVRWCCYTNCIVILICYFNLFIIWLLAVRLTAICAFKVQLREIFFLFIAHFDFILVFS